MGNRLSVILKLKLLKCDYTESDSFCKRKQSLFPNFSYARGELVKKKSSTNTVSNTVMSA